MPSRSAVHSRFRCGLYASSALVGALCVLSMGGTAWGQCSTTTPAPGETVTCTGVETNSISFVDPAPAAFTLNLIAGGQINNFVGFGVGVLNGTIDGSILSPSGAIEFQQIGNLTVGPTGMVQSVPANITILAPGGVQSLINNGSIFGSNFAVISAAGALNGTIVNNGVIGDGMNMNAILLGVGNDTVTNTGTINGAIDFGAGVNNYVLSGTQNGEVTFGVGNDTLTLRNGYTFSAGINGGGGVNTIEFDDAVGTTTFNLGDFAPGGITNFDTISKTGAGDLVITGGFATGDIEYLVSDGRLEFAGSSTATPGSNFTIDGAGALLEVTGDFRSTFGSAELRNGADLTIRGGGDFAGQTGAFVDGVGSLIQVDSGGTLETGTFSGQNAINFAAGSSGAVTNDGTIEGEVSGLLLGMGGVVTALTNNGVIEGRTSSGVDILAGGEVTNFNNSGSISAPGTATAVVSAGTIGTVFNSGAISGLNGGSFGTVTGDFENTATGNISGQSALTILSVQDFTNAGTISGQQALNISTLNGDFVNSGSISGGAGGGAVTIGALAAGSNITNAGSITAVGPGANEAFTLGADVTGVFVNHGTIEGEFTGLSAMNVADFQVSAGGVIRNDSTIGGVGVSVGEIGVGLVEGEIEGYNAGLSASGVVDLTITGAMAEIFSTVGMVGVGLSTSTADDVVRVFDNAQVRSDNAVGGTAINLGDGDDRLVLDSTTANFSAFADDLIEPGDDEDTLSFDTTLGDVTFDLTTAGAAAFELIGTEDTNTLTVTLTGSGAPTLFFDHRGGVLRIDTDFATGDAGIGNPVVDGATLIIGAGVTATSNEGVIISPNTALGDVNANGFLGDAVFIVEAGATIIENQETFGAIIDLGPGSTFSNEGLIRAPDPAPGEPLIRMGADAVFTNAGTIQIEPDLDAAPAVVFSGDVASFDTLGGSQITGTDGAVTVNGSVLSGNLLGDISAGMSTNPALAVTGDLLGTVIAGAVANNEDAINVGGVLNVSLAGTADISSMTGAAIVSGGATDDTVTFGVGATITGAGVAVDLGDGDDRFIIQPGAGLFANVTGTIEGGAGFDEVALDTGNVDTVFDLGNLSAGVLNGFESLLKDQTFELTLTGAAATALTVNFVEGGLVIDTIVSTPGEVVSGLGVGTRDLFISSMGVLNSTTDDAVDLTGVVNTITNNGVVTAAAGRGFVFETATSFLNQGQVSGGLGGVTFDGAASFDNAAGATIQVTSAGTGVFSSGAVDTFTNSGSILGNGAGGTGVNIQDDVIAFTNAAGATIDGRGAIGPGVTINGAVDNVFNGAGATITGGGVGFDITGAVNAGFVNEGTISSSGMQNGAVFGGAVTSFLNTAGASITGGLNGAVFLAPVATFANSGEIRGMAGRGVDAAGQTITNFGHTFGGLIRSDTQDGIFVNGLSGFTAGEISGGVNGLRVGAAGGALDFTVTGQGEVIGDIDNDGVGVGILGDAANDIVRLEAGALVRSGALGASPGQTAIDLGDGDDILSIAAGVSFDDDGIDGGAGAGDRLQFSTVSGDVVFDLAANPAANFEVLSTDLSNAPGSTVTIAGSSTDFDILHQGGRLVLQGAITVNSGPANLTDGVVFELAPTATLDALSTPGPAVMGGLNVTLLNNGRIDAAANGAGAVVLGDGARFGGTGDIVNTGTPAVGVEVNGDAASINLGVGSNVMAGFAAVDVSGDVNAGVLNGTLDGGATAFSAGSITDLQIGANGLVTSGTGAALDVVGDVTGGIENLGRIQGGSRGLNVGGSLANLSNVGDGMTSGLITGDVGVAVAGNVGDVDNQGAITGSVGAGVFVNGDVSGGFSNSGTIMGAANGVTLSGVTGSFVNSGEVTGAGGLGVLITQTTDVQNLAGGVIQGANIGLAVVGLGVGATVVNRGTIQGDTDAVGGEVGLALGSGADTLITSGAITVGAAGGVAVDLGLGDDRLVLESGFTFDDDIVDGGGGFDAIVLSVPAMDVFQVDLSGGFGSNFISFEAFEKSGAGVLDVLDGDVDFTFLEGGLTLSNAFAGTIDGAAGTDLVLTIGESGSLDGAATLSAGVDTLIVEGVLNGTVDLGAGDDRIDLVAGGLLNGVIDGGDGTDAVVFGGPDDITVNLGTASTTSLISVEALAKTGSGTATVTGQTDQPISFLEGGLIVQGSLNGGVIDGGGSNLRLEVISGGVIDGDVSLGEAALLTVRDGGALSSGVTSLGVDGDVLVTTGGVITGSLVLGDGSAATVEDIGAIQGGLNVSDDGLVTVLGAGLIGGGVTLGDGASLDLSDGALVQGGLASGSGAVVNATGAAALSGGSVFGDDLILALRDQATITEGVFAGANAVISLFGSSAVTGGALLGESAALTLNDQSLLTGGLAVGGGVVTVGAGARVEDGISAAGDGVFSILGDVEGEVGLDFSNGAGVQTVIVDGSIVSTGAAIAFGAGDDVLELGLNANIVGAIDGGAGVDSIRLTVPGFETREIDFSGGFVSGFANFDAVQKAGAGTLVVVGGDTDIRFSEGGLTLQATYAGAIEAVSLDGEGFPTAGPASADLVLNVAPTASLNGSAVLGSGNDTLVLGGVLNGSIDLGAGDDVIDLLSTSVINGVIDGGAGVDSLAFGGPGDITVDLGGVTGAGLISVEALAKIGSGAATVTGATDQTVSFLEGGLIVQGALDGGVIGAGASGLTLDVSDGGSIGGEVVLGSNAVVTVAGGGTLGGVTLGDGATVTIGSGAQVNGGLAGGSGTYEIFGAVSGAIGLDFSGGDGAQFVFADALIASDTPNGAAIAFGGGDDILAVGAGADFIGVVDGGSGQDTVRLTVPEEEILVLNLTAGLGVTFADFESFEKDGLGVLSLSDGASGATINVLEGLARIEGDVETGLILSAGSRLDVTEGATLTLVGAPVTVVTPDAIANAGAIRGAAGALAFTNSVTGFLQAGVLETTGNATGASALRIEGDFLDGVNSGVIRGDGGGDGLSVVGVLSGFGNDGGLIEADGDAIRAGAFDIVLGGAVRGDRDGDGVGTGIVGGDEADRLVLTGALETGGENGLAADLRGGADVLRLEGGFSLGDDRVDAGEGDDLLEWAAGDVFDLSELDARYQNFERFAFDGSQLTLSGANASVVLGLRGQVILMDATAGDVRIDGRIGGVGVVASLDVAEGGVVAPGFSPGVLTVNGDLTLGPGAVYEAEITADGAADRIDVGGVARIDGAVLDVINLDPETAFTDPFSVVLLDAAGGLEGSGFTTVNNPFAALDLSLLQDPGGAITLQVGPDMDVITGDGAMMVGEALVTDGSDPNSGLNDVFGEFVALPSGDAVDNALAELSGANHAGAAVAAASPSSGGATSTGDAGAFDDPSGFGLDDGFLEEAGGSTVNGGAEAAAASGENAAASTGGFVGGVAPFAGFANVRGRDGQPGFRASNRGLSGSLDYDFKNGWRTGLGAGVGFFEAVSDDGLGRTDAVTLGGSVKVNYNGKHILANATAGYTRLVDVDSERTVDFLSEPVVLTGSYGAYVLALNTRAAYEFDRSPRSLGAKLRPYARFDYSRFRRAAFTESGGAPALDISAQVVENAVLGTGFGLFWRVNRGGWAVGPSVSLGASYDVGDRAGRVTATFAEAGADPTPFDTTSPLVGRAAGQFGVQFLVKPPFIDVGVGIGYRGEVRDGQVSHNVGFRAARRF